MAGTKDRVSLIFSNPYGSYNAGDRAGFYPKRALELIKLGVARPANKEATKKADEAKAEAAKAEAAKEATESEVVAAVEDDNKRRSSRRGNRIV